MTGRFDPMLAKIDRARRRPARGAGPPDRGARRDGRARADDEPAVPALARPPAEVVRGEARIDTLDAIWPPASTTPTRRGRSRTAAWAEAARLLGAGGWRLNGPAVARLVADDGDGARRVAVAQCPPSRAIAAPSVAGDAVHVDIDGRSVAFRVAPPPDVDRAARAAAAHAHGGGPAEVVAPMPGAVARGPRRRSATRSRPAIRS